MAGLKREARLYAKCPGHPRLAFLIGRKDVDARHKAGHDEGGWVAGSIAMNIQDNSRYHEAHARSLADPEGFWGEAAREIDWIEPAKKVFDPASGLYGRWFAGAVVNTCYNALDRHVANGRAEQVALIHDSPLAGRITRLTYAEMLHEVKTLAAIMGDFGVAKGDRVILYMPMVPEAMIAMLACARIGAVHSVVFGGFAAKELATRIEDAKPKLIFSASCGLEPGRIVQYKPLLDEAIKLSSDKPQACIILQRPQQACELVSGRDHDWAELRAKATSAKKSAACVPVLATDPLYILYTSGTTGKPKGVVRDNGGHLVALKWSMFNLYGVNPGEVWWCGADIGWVVGHSYIIYGPLFHGATSIMYEGKPIGTPDAGAFWRVISEHKAVAFFTAPTAFRAIRKEDPDGKFIRRYDLTKFRTLFLAGERADPPTVEWAEQQLKVPVIDHWWQTETGWPITANCLGLEPMPVKHGSSTKPAPGWDLRVLGPDGHEVKRGEIGALCLKLPLPPGALPTLWNADERFVDSYLKEYPGHYETADAGYVDADGYVFVMTRTDDIINVAGHRLSTGGIEEVLAAHPDVAECAVIGVADGLKGQVPVGFLVLKAGAQRLPAQVAAEAVKLVRDRIGPVASFKTAMVVQRLPKTRSGKILRGTMRRIADGEDYKTPATIDDPAILGEIADTLKDAGYAKA